MPRALVLKVLAVFAASRLVGAAALALDSNRGGYGLDRPIRGFDGFWYGLINAKGYVDQLPVDVHGLVKRNQTAFFPAFPLLTEPFTAIGLPFWGAALIVNTIAGGLAAVCIAGTARLVARRTVLATDPATSEDPTADLLGEPVEPAAVTERRKADRVGLVAAGLWCTLPVAFVLTIAYSEAVFTAFAAACLFSLSRGRWAGAGVFAALASATRPSGFVLAFACLAGAAVACWRERRAYPIVAPLLAPWGGVAYLVYLWLRTGRTDSWFRTEREGWHTYTDWGVANWNRGWHALVENGTAAEKYVAITAIVMVLFLLWMIIERLPLHLIVYAAGILALTLATRNVYSSIPRMLLPAFPLLIPLARRTGRAPWPVAALLLLITLAGSGLAAYVLMRNPGFAP